MTHSRVGQSSRRLFERPSWLTIGWMIVLLHTVGVARWMLASAGMTAVRAGSAKRTATEAALILSGYFTNSNSGPSKVISNTAALSELPTRKFAFTTGVFKSHQEKVSGICL